MVNFDNKEIYSFDFGTNNEIFSGTSPSVMSKKKQIVERIAHYAESLEIEYICSLSKDPQTESCAVSDIIVLIIEV